ncbi:EF-hand protein 5 [Trypanosoma conorhini]|uniref:EF-hand protein 5 n=1 Tax=Trypanosoma conorhini TaxID=83891 RepID=A0A422N3G6_9TRYP|nr:EF-hand protein 5 [Trypanosoma conorhini]RNE99979.1 EF-hand protein 5 [Trypanosoma conorhini]
MEPRGPAGAQFPAKAEAKAPSWPRHNSPQSPTMCTARDSRAMNRPLYRGPLSHNVISELAEGFRQLGGGQKKHFIPAQLILETMKNVGMHLSADEFQDVLRVVGQSEPQNADELSFSDFLLLMTREVEETMAEELRSAFHHYDKQRTGFVTRKQFTELFATLGERSPPEELEELLSLAEVDEVEEKIDYSRFVRELASRVNNM